MMTVRKAGDRGHSMHGWLDSRHTFSFAEYYDPQHMGFGPLRVINDDRVAPGQGFGQHGHRDMEIVSYVVDGELAHRDSMGNGSVMRPGDVQRMSAGTGVLHSEMNPSREHPVRFLQIWIEPAQRGIAPGYEQKFFSPETRRGQLRLVASSDGRDGSITLHQDADLYATLLGGSDRARLALRPGRGAWIQIVRGSVTANGAPLVEGDGVAISNEDAIELRDAADAELLVFDLGPRG